MRAPVSGVSDEDPEDEEDEDCCGEDGEGED